MNVAVQGIQVNVNEEIIMVESIQHKLDRVRPPRVQITYDVEIGNAIEMKELPFVVGILADWECSSNCVKLKN